MAHMARDAAIWWFIGLVGFGLCFGPLAWLLNNGLPGITHLLDLLTGA